MKIRKLMFGAAGTSVVLLLIYWSSSAAAVLRETGHEDPVAPSLLFILLVVPMIWFQARGPAELAWHLAWITAAAAFIVTAWSTAPSPFAQHDTLRDLLHWLTFGIPALLCLACFPLRFMTKDFRDSVDSPETKFLREECEARGRAIAQYLISSNVNWNKVPTDGITSLLSMAPHFLERCRDKWECSECQAQLDDVDFRVLQWKVDGLLYAASPARYQRLAIAGTLKQELQRMDGEAWSLLKRLLKENVAFEDAMEQVACLWLPPNV